MGFLEVINCLLYVIVFFIYWRKHKMVDAYFILIAGFAFTSIISMAYQFSGESTFLNTTLFPYLYLFVCILICLRPFKQLDIGNLSNISESPMIKVLTLIYIISGIFSIYYTIPKAVELFYADQWDLIRQSLYEGEDMELYSSAFERLCKNIHSYLSPFGVIMCFFELTKKHKNRILIILLFGTWLLDSLLGATLVASRGIVVNVLLNFILILVIFKKAISSKTKKLLVSFGGVLAIPTAIYLFIVSIARFGEGEASGSAFMYLGHAMQCFNCRVMGSMHDYAWGKYAFNYFFEDKSINMQALGNNANNAFYTVIGDFYIDWGPVVTILLCLLLMAILSYFTHKKQKSLSDLVVIVYFASFFMRGMFVYGRGYALQWIMLVVVWLIIRISEKRLIVK